MTASGAKQCRCPPQFEGAQCQENKCSRCQEGKCSINKQNGEVSCMYVPGLLNSKEGEGLGGTETQEGTCVLWPDHPGTATAARCWFSNSGLAVEGQLRPVGALRVTGGSGGGVCPGPSW